MLVTRIRFLCGSDDDLLANARFFIKDCYVSTTRLFRAKRGFHSGELSGRGRPRPIRARDSAGFLSQDRQMLLSKESVYC